MASKRKSTPVKKIWKTVYKFVVLSEEPIPAKSEFPDIMEECETGRYIGDVVLSSSKVMKPERVKRQLLNMGNDGTFFDDIDD